MEAPQSDVKMRILLAAKKLFAKQGFDATTVRQICEEAGANVALVSYHFGGKEKVFHALFETFFPGYQLDLYKNELQDPIKGIQTVVREVIRFRMEDPEMGTIIQQEFFTESPRITAILPHIMPVWKTLDRLLEKGKSEGLFHYRSTRFTLLMILGNIIFPNSTKVHLHITEHEEQTVEQRINDTIQFVLGGLGYDLHKGGENR